jgi:hypothetical protein
MYRHFRKERHFGYRATFSWLGRLDLTNVTCTKTRLYSQNDVPSGRAYRPIIISPRAHERSSSFQLDSTTFQIPLVVTLVGGGGGGGGRGGGGGGGWPFLVNSSELIELSSTNIVDSSLT